MRGTLAIVLGLAGAWGCGKVELHGSEADDPGEAGQGGESSRGDGGGRPALTDPGPMTGLTGGRGAAAAEGGASDGAAGKMSEGGKAGAAMMVPGASGGPAGHGGSSPGCPPGQLDLMGKCGCPAYAPDYCSEVGKCVATTKDPDHCGQCDVQCGETEGCWEGSCTAGAEELEVTVNCGLMKLVHDGSWLYVLDPGGGVLFYVDPELWQPVGLARYLVGASAFTIAGDNAYVVSEHDVLRVGISVEGTTTVVSSAALIYDVAVGGDHLYYATGHNVMKVPLDAVAASGTVVATAVDEGEPLGVAVNATHALFVSGLSFNVEARALTGGDPFKVGASQGALLFGHRSIQTSGPYVFWVNGAVQGASLSDPEHFQMSAAYPRGDAAAFAVAFPDLYIASLEGDIEQSTLSGETSTWLARGLGQVTSLVADDDYVYAASGCSVFSVPC